MTRECVRQGHCKIVFLTFLFDCLGLDERVRGFCAATEEVGIAKQCKIITAKELSFEAVKQAFADCQHEFSLVLGSDDRIACFALRILTEQGRKIPEEVSVIGWNNSRFLEYLTLPLASVSIPMKKIGYRAAQIILKNLTEGPTVSKEYIDEQFVVRESFAPFQS